MQIRANSFFISGGASGLGAACARRLVAGGGRVVLADIDAAQGAALASELGEAARFAEADVADEVSTSAALALCRDAFGGPHAAIQCAGILGAGRMLGREGPLPLSAFAKVVQVNLVGTFNVCRLAAAAMAENEPTDEGERGVLVNTSSVSAFEGQIGQAAYAASKGGVASMCLPLARELARFGIRVVAIAPGVFDTPMMEGTSEELRNSLVSQIPFPPRFGRPGEFAALVEHVIENVMLNGTTLRLDAATRMGAK